MIWEGFFKAYKKRMDYPRCGLWKLIYYYPEAAFLYYGHSLIHFFKSPRRYFKEQKALANLVNFCPCCNKTNIPGGDSMFEECDFCYKIICKDCLLKITLPVDRRNMVCIKCKPHYHAKYFRIK